MSRRSCEETGLVEFGLLRSIHITHLISVDVISSKLSVSECAVNQPSSRRTDQSEWSMRSRCFVWLVAATANWWLHSALGLDEIRSDEKPTMWMLLNCCYSYEQGCVQCIIRNSYRCSIHLWSFAVIWYCKTAEYVMDRRIMCIQNVHF